MTENKSESKRGRKSKDEYPTITLTSNFRLVIDPQNINLEQLKESVSREGVSEMKWNHIGYYTSLESACKRALTESLRDTDKTDIKAVLCDYRALVDEIKEAVGKVKVIKR